MRRSSASSRRSRTQVPSSHCSPIQFVNSQNPLISRVSVAARSHRLHNPRAIGIRPLRCKQWMEIRLSSRPSNIRQAIGLRYFQSGLLLNRYHSMDFVDSLFRCRFVRCSPSGEWNGQRQGRTALLWVHFQGRNMPVAGPFHLQRSRPHVCSRAC